nr:3-keto-5-aminohexanoate cleavage protein [Deinobacterium chartae]
MLLEAGRREHATRSGLEDTLYLPGGELAPDNAALVSAAHRLLAGSAEAQR